MAYFFDGLANASSILVGKAIGARDKHLYKKTLILSLQWGVLSSLVLAVSYYLCADAILALFTRIPSVIELANIYGIWLILFPLTASVGIVFYGVFTGATEAAPIRNSMIYSLIAFVITLYIFVPAYQNHALWLAFTVFSLGRSVFLALYIPRLSEKYFQIGVCALKTIKWSRYQEKIIHTYMDTYKILLEEDDLSPNNEIINRVLTELVSMISKPLDQHVAEEILNHDEIRSIRDTMLEKLTIAETLMEDHYAKLFVGSVNSWMTSVLSFIGKTTKN